MTDNIDEYARKVAERCLAFKQGNNRFDLTLSAQVIQEFVKSVYYASMIPDEGRYPLVCLMCYRKRQDNSFHFPIKPPLQTTPKEIAKLAHATAPGSHVYCVCEDGKIELGGIHVTRINEMRELGYSSFRTGNPLKLVIRGPGHIEASSCGTPLAYKEGEITQVKTFQFSSILASLAVSIEQELRDKTVGAVESLESIFNDLAEAIVRLGHGGMLIVAKDTENHFSSKKKIDCLIVHQLLIRYWNDVSTNISNSGGLGNLMANHANGVFNPHALTIASDVMMLEDALDSTAHLSGVDGAIVMDYSCKVVAFNAIIDKSLGDVVICELVDPQGHVLNETTQMNGRGSRHQSALSYAKRVPNSFAFVISQDGGVSAFHNPDGSKVVCELGMRVLD